MLTAYLDESWDDDDGYFVVAGFLGHKGQWEWFANEWHIEVGSDAFHMKSLSWDSPATEKRLARLGPLPAKHGLVPLSGAVRVSDYKDLLVNPLEQRMINGYSVSLYPVAIGVYRDLPANERVKWVFEQQRTYEVAAREVFASLGWLIRDRLSGIEFVPSDSTCLIQPADYLAHAVLQNLRDPNSMKAKWTTPIFGNIAPVGMTLNRSQIREIVGKMMPEARQKTFEGGKDDIESGYSTYEQFVEKLKMLPSDKIKNFFHARKEKLRGEQ
jgi:hypothetical protein